MEQETKIELSLGLFWGGHYSFLGEFTQQTHQDFWVSARVSQPYTARHQFTLQDHGHGASTLHSVPVYAPACTRTHGEMTRLS